MDGMILIGDMDGMILIGDMDGIILIGGMDGATLLTIIITAVISDLQLVIPIIISLMATEIQITQILAIATV